MRATFIHNHTCVPVREKRPSNLTLQIWDRNIQMICRKPYVQTPEWWMIYSHSGVYYMLLRCCLETSAFLAPAKIPQEQHDMQVFLTWQRLIMGFLGFPSLLGMIWGQTSHQANRSAIFKPLQRSNHTSLNKCLNYCTCLKGMFPT